MGDALFNLESYTSLELALFGCSALMWLAVYVLILHGALKRQFVGIPILAIGCVFSWQFLWGYVFRTDLGSFFTWGLEVFFPMCLWLGWLTLRHGHKQLPDGPLQRYSTSLVLSGVVACTVLLYAFSSQADDGAGLTSATLIGLIISARYIPLLMQLYEREGARGLAQLSYAVAWLKMLGAAFLTACCLLHLPERTLVHAVGLVTFFLDMLYIMLFRYLRGPVVLQAPLSSPPPAATRS